MKEKRWIWLEVGTGVDQKGTVGATFIAGCLVLRNMYVKLCRYISFHLHNPMKEFMLFIPICTWENWETQGEQRTCPLSYSLELVLMGFELKEIKPWGSQRPCWAFFWGYLNTTTNTGQSLCLLFTMQRQYYSLKKKKKKRWDWRQRPSQGPRDPGHAPGLPNILEFLPKPSPPSGAEENSQSPWPPKRPSH